MAAWARGASSPLESCPTRTDGSLYYGRLPVDERGGRWSVPVVSQWLHGVIERRGVARNVEARNVVARRVVGRRVVGRRVVGRRVVGRKAVGRKGNITRAGTSEFQASSPGPPATAGPGRSVTGREGECPSLPEGEPSGRPSFTREMLASTAPCRARRGSGKAPTARLKLKI